MYSVSLNSENIVNNVGIFNDSVVVDSKLGNNIGMNSVSCKFSRDEQ